MREALTSRSAREGERKQVTVLFADMRGSLELLADRDPEDARSILDPVLQRMIEAVHRYEGTVNQVMGDGIMALFGAPRAQEDHAVRACYAALGMQDAVRRYAEAVRATHGIDIQIRVGLNSGEVVARAMATDLQLDYTAVGQATHLAARMEQLARPGGILLTAETLRLAEGHVHVEPLGLTPVKGLGGSLQVYELTGAAAPRSRLQVRASRGLSRFVGRDLELQQLARAFERVEAGRGQVVAVVGEPGAGKSRLIYEVAGARRASRWLFLETTAFSYGRETAYLPIAELLRSYFRVEPRDEPRRAADRVRSRIAELDEQLRPAIPALLALLGAPVDDDAEWAGLPASRRRRKTLEAVTRLVLRESLAQPVCLVVEDLHWIDSETQAVLDDLVENLAPARVLVLVSYRPEYQHGWGSKSVYTQVRVDPLTAADAAALLQALLGGDPTLDPFKRLLVERTGGNPFFLEECVRAVAETGALEGSPGAYRLVRPVTTLQVPATVHGVLAARIDRMPPEDKALLETAAVIGKDVPLALLAAVAELPDEVLHQRLARLRAVDLLDTMRLFPDVEYTFPHALTHEVVYTNLLHHKRRALHVRIVQVIERLAGDRASEQVERLAHHARGGELWDRATRYLHQAGSKAFAHSANREAVAWFEQALAALARVPETPATLADAADLHLGLRNALTLLGDHQRTLAHLREAQAIAERIGDRRRLGRALSFEVNCLLLLGRHEAAVEVGRRARAVAVELDDAALRSVTDMYVGRAHFQLGAYAQAIETFGAIAAALTGPLAHDHLGVPVLPSVFARSHLAEALAEVGRFDEAARVAGDGVAIAETANHPDTLFWAYRGSGMQHLCRGDVAAATAALERAHVVCRTHDMASSLTRISAELGLARALAGRVADAVPMVERALQEAGARKQAMTYSKVLQLLAQVYLLGGRVGDAADAAVQALELFRFQRERGHEASTLRLLGDVRARQGQPIRAESDYRAAAALARSLGMRPLVARCEVALAQVLAATGRRDEATACLRGACVALRAMGLRDEGARAEASLGPPG
ncbi:MAG TPA: adenylate/guanylate cyclase domain-containing protein [Candidatus Tectomicrobia bacterium]|nr:adenylate/guanylate cyclase domain-containing protein [Candidatus Tectomicrobia bacterium]